MVMLPKRFGDHETMIAHQTFIISSELTDLNTYIHANRSSRFLGAKIKKENTELVAWEAKSQKLSPITVPCSFVFNWYCRNKKKDKDNISFAKKFILDGLQEAGIIKNDGWNDVINFTDYFYLISEIGGTITKPCVIVSIHYENTHETKKGKIAH